MTAVGLIPNLAHPSMATPPSLGVQVGTEYPPPDPRLPGVPSPPNTFRVDSAAIRSPADIPWLSDWSNELLAPGVEGGGVRKGVLFLEWLADTVPAPCRLWELIHVVRAVATASGRTGLCPESEKC